MKNISSLFIILILSLVMVTSSFAMGTKTDKKAIVLAGFGTSYPSALVAITNIRDTVQKAFPKTTVKLAFTSNIIRKIWHRRQNDQKFLADNPNIPKDILYVKGPLATIADLQDEGYNIIIVQPTHIYFGEEYSDLSSYINGLNSIKTIKAKFMPFKKLVIGRPLLGKCGIEHDYHEDLIPAAKALAPDVELAKKNKAALVTWDMAMNITLPAPTSNSNRRCDKCIRKQASLSAPLKDIHPLIMSSMLCCMQKSKRLS